mgnify:CR=1 FL=1
MVSEFFEKLGGMLATSRDDRDVIFKGGNVGKKIELTDEEIELLEEIIFEWEDLCREDLDEELANKIERIMEKLRGN